MLEIIRDENNNIKAVCEWNIVDSEGRFDQKGEFVWVSEVEIAPQYRGNGILKEFAKTIMLKCPQARFGYFYRLRKYPKRGVRIYHKIRWLKLLGGKL